MSDDKVYIVTDSNIYRKLKSISEGVSLDHEKVCKASMTSNAVEFTEKHKDAIGKAVASGGFLLTKSPIVAEGGRKLVEKFAEPLAVATAEILYSYDDRFDLGFTCASNPSLSSSRDKGARR